MLNEDSRLLEIVNSKYIKVLNKSKYGIFSINDNRAYTPSDRNEYKRRLVNNDRTCRVLTPDEFEDKLIGTCWERTLYLYYKLKQDIGLKDVYGIYIEDKSENLTHTDIVVRLGREWYSIGVDKDSKFFLAKVGNNKGESYKTIRKVWGSKVKIRVEIDLDKILKMKTIYYDNFYEVVSKSGKRI